MADRVRRRDQREAGRRSDGRARSLYGPGDDQREAVGGQAAHERCDGEDADAGQKRPLVADGVADAAADQQQAAERQDVRGDDPALARIGEVEIGLQPTYSMGEDYGTVDVIFSAHSATASCTLVLDGKKETRNCRCVYLDGESEEERARDVAHTVRRSVYRAYTKLTGARPAWGALSGVRPGKLARFWMEEGHTREETLARLENHYYLRRDKAELTLQAADVAAKLKSELRPRDIALYVDVPFCPTRCAYCSFISRAAGGAGEELINAYLSALQKEISAAAEAFGRSGVNIRAVYIGGGTPTTLSPAQLDGLLSGLEAVNIPKGCEYTLEAGRPDTITSEKLAVAAAHGVTRVSVNPQTFSERVLRNIGRSHGIKEIYRAFDLVRSETAFEINMDLIAGLPGDSTAIFADSVMRTADLGPEDVTVHTLALKRGSDFSEKIAGKTPSQAAISVMVEGGAEILGKFGYEPYYLYRQKYMNGSFENVGYAREGKICAYNVYMMDELLPVVALGCGGSTKIAGEGGGRFLRITNPKYPEEYISRIDGIAEKKRGLEF